MVKKLSEMSAREVRDLLAEKYAWDLEALARDHRIGLQEAAALLRNGGGELEKTPDTPAVASYDVLFVPMVNVKVAVANPENPTETEIESIIDAAVEEVAKQFYEKVNTENLQFVRLYQKDATKPDALEYNLYVEGAPLVVDPRFSE